MATWVLALVRGLSLLGASGLLGLALFRLLERSAAAPGRTGDSPPARPEGPERAAPALALLATAAGLLWLAVQLWALNSPPFGPVARSLLTTADFGWQWLLRQGLAGAAFAAIARGAAGAHPGSGCPARSTQRLAAAALPALAAGLLLAHALSGHAAADPFPALPVAADALHLLASGLWFGGLLGLCHALRSDAPPALVRRFSRLALAAVVILAATGLHHALRRVSGLDALTGTPYGQLLALKLAVLAAALLLAARNHADVRRGLIGPALARRVGWETGLVGLVVVLGGALASLPPGQLGQVFSVQAQDVPTPAGTWKLEIRPAGPGRVHVRAYPPPADGGPPAGTAPAPAAPAPDGGRFRARFVMQDMAMPPAGFDLRPDGKGGVEGSGRVLSMPGSWEVRVEHVQAGRARLWARTTFQAEPQRENQPPQGLQGLGFAWSRTLNRDIFDVFRDPGGGAWAAGRQGLFFSPDGRSWQAVPGRLPAPAYRVARLGQRLLVATAGGLFVREEGAGAEVPWQPVELPGRSGAVYDVAAGPGVAYALDPGALYRITPGPDGLRVERLPVPGHPEPDPVNRVWVDPARADHIWIARTGPLEESRDGGRSFRPLRPGRGEETLASVQALVPDPRQPGAVWVAAMAGGVAVSADGGNTWALRNAGLPETSLMALVPGPGPGDWYAGTMYHGVAASDDGGRSWRPAGLTNATVQDMEVLPDGTVLVATSAMGLFAGKPEPPRGSPRPLGPVAALLWGGGWAALVALAYPGLRAAGTAGARVGALWTALALLSAAVLPLAVWGGGV